MLPFSLMDYLPKFFFASFLVYFGVEIMYEWLARCTPSAVFAWRPVAVTVWPKRSANEHW